MYTNRQMLVLFIATFFFGMGTGALIFFGLDFTRTFTTIPESPYTIIVSEHGPCRQSKTCVSYRLTETGAYILLRDVPDGRTVRSQGNLPESRHTPLARTIKDAPWSSLEEQFPYRAACTSQSVPTYTIEKTQDGVTTYFSTCETRDVEIAPVVRELSDLITIFKELESSTIPSL